MTCLDRTLADRLLRIFKLSPWSRSLADRNLRIFKLLSEPLFGGPQLADFQTPFGAALWRTAFADFQTLFWNLTFEGFICNLTLEGFICNLTLEGFIL